MEGGNKMYFVQLRNLKEYDRSLLYNFDCILRSLHSSSQYFTPQQIQSYLNLSSEDSFKLLFRARDIGVISTIEVSKCIQCGRLLKINILNKSCPECKSCSLKNGYFFTTESHNKIFN